MTIGIYKRFLLIRKKLLKVDRESFFKDKKIKFAKTITI